MEELMTGLSKITDKIIAEANKDSERVLAEADAECRRIAAECKQKAEKIKSEIDARAERDAAAIVTRARSTAAVEQRDLALSARSDLVDKAFESAKKELSYLPDDKYLEFLTSILASILTKQLEDEKISREVYGEEDAPTVEAYEVLLSKRDLDKHGKTLLESLRRRLIGKCDNDLLSKVRVCPTPVNIDGGLILRCGNVEINGSLSMLFRQARPAMEARVSRILFENE